MKVFETKNIKNVTLLGHAGSGKTTLAECMLFESGYINRRGTVENGNTISDFHEIEHERGNSVFASLMHARWKDSKINIIDTPGFDDFVGEVISALRVADTGIMVLNTTQGVEVGTELIWAYTEEFKTPMILVVNQVDHEKSDFDGTYEQAKLRFGDKVTMVQYPLEQGQAFDSIIDVLKMVMYKFPEEGGKPEKLPIPDDQKTKADQLHNDLIEAIAVNDEGLMEKYFDQGSLTEEEMTKGLKLSMVNHDIFPLFACSSKRNMGSGRIMGFINDVAPATMDVPPATRMSGKTLECDSSGPACAFVFKTISEPHLGDMSFFKVFSGEITSGSELINSGTDNSERINQLFLLNGKNREQVTALKAGDIGATVKLKKTHTNNTLHVKGSPFRIDPIVFPISRISMGIEAASKGEIEKMSIGLHTLVEEDPTLISEYSSELKQTILSGQGEMHLSIAKWKLEKNYKVHIQFVEPKIPYRETITQMVKKDYKHKKQSGGAGQFGEVHMMVEPWYEGMPDPSGVSVRNRIVEELAWGGRLEFLWCIVGGAIDNKYTTAIMKGVMEKMVDGPLTGSYVRDVRVSVYDGKMHPVDSNDMAFKIAGSMAFKSAFVEAAPQILEPIFHVEVLAATDVIGDIMSDLQTRRAIIEGMEADGHYQKVIARIPLKELYKYASTLRSISQGRAKHTQKFLEYAPLPYNLQQELVNANKEAAEA